MNKRKLTILSLVFALVLLLGFALCVSAEEVDATADLGEPVETWDISAMANDNVVANLYNDPDNEGMYTLVISGSGEMGKSPWYSYREKITKVDIKEGVTNILSNQFNLCSNLINISIPNSIKTIGIWTFPNTLIYNEYDNGYYLGNETNPYVVFVKAKNKEISSCRINEATKIIYCEAFEECSLLLNIEITNNIVDIGSWAFSGCTRLTNIKIPDNIEHIGTAPFANCTSLTDIELPNNLTSITDNMFAGCTSLTNIEIPNSVTSIGGAAFYCCTSLTNIEIPDSVTSIGDSAFYNCNSLTNVVIGNSVTSIGDSTFENCKSLKKIKIGNGVNSIGSKSFLGCIQLEEVVIPKNVSYLGSRVFEKCKNLNTVQVLGSVEVIPYLAFSSCSNLTNVSFSEGVKKVDTYAFVSCSNLETIILPQSTEIIGNNAFEGCRSLSSIHIPSNVKSIGKHAFSDCINVNNIYIQDVKSWCEIDFYDGTNVFSSPLDNGYQINGDINFYINGVLTTDIVIPEGVTAIKSRYFTYTSITSITLPNSVTEISSGAFGYCKNLKNVTMSKNLTSIGDSAFGGCTSLENIAIPEGVTKISERAFYNCTSLIDITIPNSVRTIEANAFYNCSKMKNVNFSEGLLDIGEAAFYGCNGLTSIVIPKGVKTIGSSAFSNCHFITSVTIPDSVTYIGTSAFYGYRYNNLYIENLDAWCKIEFGNLYSIPLWGDGNLYLNGELIENLVIPSSVTSIGDYAFYGCSSFTNIEIPDSITSIGSDAFRSCRNVKVVIINSPTIASSITTSNSSGYLTSYATTIAINPEITEIGSYITDNFTNVTTLNVIYNSETVEYVVYSKHSHEADAGVWSEKDANCVQVCSECGLQKVVHVAGEAVIENVIDATCQVNGSYDEVVYCTDCGAELSRTKVETPKLDHTEVEIPMVRPTPSTDGYTAGVKCSECDEYIVEPQLITVTDMANMGDPAFRIDAASLDLAESICVFYKIKASNEYKNPHMVFIFDGIEYPITEYTIEPSTGRYVFRFTNAPAYKMAENIEAYVYAEASDGGYTRNQLPNYSIMTYCVNQLKKSSISDEFRTVISDVLALGASNQVYEGYKTDKLVTELVKEMGYTLTPSVYEGIDSTKNKMSMVGDATASTNWTTANLVIGSNVQVQLKLKTDNIDNVTVKIDIGGEVTEYTKDDFKAENGVYIVVLDRLTSKQYDEAITATLYEGDTQVGGTLTYSINSYLFRNAENSSHSDEMKSLLQTLYVYGETMKAYFN